MVSDELTEYIYIRQEKSSSLIFPIDIGLCQESHKFLDAPKTKRCSSKGNTRRREESSVGRERGRVRYMSSL